MGTLTEQEMYNNIYYGLYKNMFEMTKEQERILDIFVEREIEADKKAGRYKSKPIVCDCYYCSRDEEIKNM